MKTEEKLKKYQEKLKLKIIMEYHTDKKVGIKTFLN